MKNRSFPPRKTAPSRFHAAVVIPVLDEVENLPWVLRRVPRGLRVVCADNGSSDGSPETARRLGAEVVRELRKGYGAACRAGLRRLAKAEPDAVAFLDADGSVDPALLPRLLEPIRRGCADLVLGQRAAALREPGAMPPQARFGNALAVGLIRLFWGARYSDLGPFRAVRWDALQRLNLRDETWGWTVEMQVRAAEEGLRVLEIPVPYRRRRRGRSKISGTFRGTLKAGWKILATLAVLRIRRWTGAGKKSPARRR